MCKHAVKKLRYVIRYVANQYNTQQMHYKGILKNDGTLKSVSDCHKNLKMCNKAVDNFSHALEFVPDCYMIQNVSDKAVSTCPSTKKILPE